jgi:hypothetical protein
VGTSAVVVSEFESHFGGSGVKDMTTWIRTNDETRSWWWESTEQSSMVVSLAVRLLGAALFRAVRPSLHEDFRVTALCIPPSASLLYQARTVCFEIASRFGSYSARLL